MNPDWIVLSAVFGAGVLGSVHCAAMCGGIAVGLNSATGHQAAAAAALRLNLGRLLGYALAGTLAGAGGAGLVQLFASPLLQRSLRMLIGLVLIAAALRLLDRRGRLPVLAAGGRGLWRLLAPLHRRLLPANTAWRQLGAGMLWGWLPCGLSASFLAAAWLTVDALQGALLMLTFGGGTLIAMLPLTYSGSRFALLSGKPGLRQATAVCLALAGVITLGAPWLATLPGLHVLLSAAGCLSLAGG